MPGSRRRRTSHERPRDPLPVPQRPPRPGRGALVRARLRVAGALRRVRAVSGGVGTRGLVDGGRLAEGCGMSLKTLSLMVAIAAMAVLVALVQALP